MTAPVIICIVLSVCGFLFWASASIRSGVYLRAFCRERTTGKVVYLTFDDGPVRGERYADVLRNTTCTTGVLDVLRKHGARATFFIIGKNISGNEDLVRQALADGHELGIHSWSHANTFPLYSKSRMNEDILRCKRTLEALSGEEIRLFRPPFGVVNPTIARSVKRLGLQTVGWSIRSFDTVRYNRPGWQQRVVRRVMRRLHPGAVILLHDRLSEAPALLSTLLDRLSAAGYRFDRPLPR